MYDNDCTVLPRPISSASKAFPADFSKKSSPSRWKFSRFPLNCFPGFASWSRSVFFGFFGTTLADGGNFFCQMFFDKISRGYLSIIHFIWATFFGSSGTIASYSPSPYQAWGMIWETIATALSPVTFQLQVPENLSNTYSKVPKFVIDLVDLRWTVFFLYES